MAPKMREKSSSEEYESEPESEEEVVKSDSEGGDDEKEVEKSESQGGDDEGSDEEGSPISPTASNFTIKSNNLMKPSSKRPLEVCKDDGKESRSQKKAKEAVEIVKTDKVSSVVSGQGAIQRVWSDEDELHLLQGFMDYRDEKGDPYANKTNKAAFYDFVKGRLFAGVGYNQVYEKLRRLKEKFEKIQGQRKARDTVFSTPHELERFELSEKVWGGGSKGKELEQKTKAKSKNVEYGGKTTNSLLNSNAKVSVVKEKNKKDDKGGNFVDVVEEKKKKDDKGGDFVDGVDMKAKSKNVEYSGKTTNSLLNSNAKVSVVKEKNKKDDKGGNFVDVVEEKKKKDDKGGDFVDGVDMKTTNGKQRADGSSEFLSEYPYLCRSFDGEMIFFKDNVHRIGKDMAQELEDGWVQLEKEQMQLASKRLSLLSKQTDLVLDAIKKG